jgi:hypothetical protein
MSKNSPNLYTDEQISFLKNNCSLSRPELTLMFNERFGTAITQSAISSYCKRYGWLTGRDGRLKKGNKPWNTGLKGRGVCKSNSTSFKKGQVPANVKPLGHERICSKDGFILIKVAEENPYTGAKTRYRLKHQFVWEQHHGDIPDGCVIRFKDGNKFNCEIDNLLCETLAVNLQMNRNRVNDLPDDLIETGQAIARLEVATFTALRGL